MPRSNEYKSMPMRMVLKLIKQGIYSANLETGEVLDRRGKVMAVSDNSDFGNGTGHLHVRLYWTDPGTRERWRKTLYVHQLVWMVKTQSVIPKGWEIHHKDDDPLNNVATNLICCHPVDHREFHNYETDDTSFSPDDW